MTSSRWPAALAALTALTAPLALGCTGGGGSTGTAGSTTGTSGTSGTGGSTGGTTSTSGTEVGEISLNQLVIDVGGGNTVVSSYALAQFTLQPLPNPCTTTQVGPCVVTSCPLTDAGFPLPELASVGTISVDTSDIDGGPLVLTTDGGVLPQASYAAETFESGDPIIFSVSGGVDIAAFTTTVTAPAPIGLDAPDVDGGPVIDRADDFDIDWDVVGPPNGQVALSVNGHLVSARCVYDVSAGSGTVPKAALQMLPAGAGSLTASSFSQVEQPVGAGRTVLLQVFSDGAGTLVDLE